MDAKTVRDVLGEPERWPSHLNGELHSNQNMRGATISLVIASGDQVAIQTKHAPCGETFSVFLIEDPKLRERTVRALKQGVEVHEAVAAAI